MNSKKQKKITNNAKHKNQALLKMVTTQHGKILHRSVTELTKQNQKNLKKFVKQARNSSNKTTTKLVVTSN